MYRGHDTSRIAINYTNRISIANLSNAFDWPLTLPCTYDVTDKFLPECLVSHEVARRADATSPHDHFMNDLPTNIVDLTDATASPSAQPLNEATYKSKFKPCNVSPTFSFMCLRLMNLSIKYLQKITAFLFNISVNPIWILRNYRSSIMAPCWGQKCLNKLFVY